MSLPDLVPNPPAAEPMSAQRGEMLGMDDFEGLTVGDPDDCPCDFYHRAAINWMSFIRDDVRLIDLVIPGSHDSATYSMRGAARPFVQTQSYNLLAQLLCGIRYLDLRVRGSAARPVVNHNIVKGRATEHLLRRQVAPFVHRFPSEVLILDFQELGRPCRRTVVEQLREHLDADRWALPRSRFSTTLTLGDLRAGGYRFLVLFGGMSEAEFQRARREGWLPEWVLRRGDVLHSPYDAVLYARGTSGIPAFLTSHSQAWATKRDRLFVAQGVCRQNFVATAIDALRELAKGVRGRSWWRLPDTPAWLDTHQGHHLDGWIDALTPESPANILMRDFVDRHYATIGKALRLNLQRGHAVPGEAATRLDTIAGMLEHGREWCAARQMPDDAGFFSASAT
ncbi:hypothetical protein SAMN05216486_10394 [bacterium JGI 053]|nr:hypothetical protein SAMN05216486_10394 [bacterium JGI 053]